MTPHKVIEGPWQKTYTFREKPGHAWWCFLAEMFLSWAWQLLPDESEEKYLLCRLMLPYWQHTNGTKRVDLVTLQQKVDIV